MEEWFLQTKIWGEEVNIKEVEVASMYRNQVVKCGQCERKYRSIAGWASHER